MALKAITLFVILVFSKFVVIVNPSQSRDDNDDMSIMKHKSMGIGNVVAGGGTHVTTSTTAPTISTTQSKMLEEYCPVNTECTKLDYPCISFQYNFTCVYGAKTPTRCTALVDCIGEREFYKDMICRYCYQTDHWEHTCVQKGNCNAVSSPKTSNRTNCTVNNDVLCLGRRTFLKNLPCNWTNGYRWSTALTLSITLGGFGADRFYLGHWQEGIGKLFSFGGLGVWTLIDVVLIAIHYLGPADGSLYT